MYSHTYSSTRKVVPLDLEYNRNKPCFRDGWNWKQQKYRHYSISFFKFVKKITLIDSQLSTLAARVYSTNSTEKKTDKQIFNSHRYDTILSKGNLSGPTQIGSRREMWPHSDSLIWHLLLQTESVGPWGCQERRDRGVIESSSLDLIGKWDEMGPKFGWVSKTIAFYLAQES